MTLRLCNPHSVLAALETRPDDVLEISIPSGPTAEGWERVAKLAQARKIPVSSASRKPPNEKDRKRFNPSESPRGGLAEARVKERVSLELEELWKGQTGQTGSIEKGLWLALDCLQDPHNVGAIFRTAAFFGVRGIILTQERSAPLTSTVYDVAAGGMEYVPFSIQTNLSRALKIGKEAGLWTLGTSEHARDDLQKIQVDRAWLAIIGNEEKGIRRLTEESCDLLCKISGSGKVGSLNASVAAGIMMAQLSDRGRHQEK